MRSGFGFGRATVEPPINSAFLAIFRQFVDLSNDDRNGIDPLKIKPGVATITDPRQFEQVRAFLRDYKRSIIRLVTNLSSAGTTGTRELTEKWALIMAESMKALADVAKENVVSNDSDAHFAWPLLAAITGIDRDEIQKYIVQADSGMQLLRDAIGIYDKIQSPRLLSKEDDSNLRMIFLTQGLSSQIRTVAERVLKFQYP